MAKNLGNVAGVVRGINPPKEADGTTEKRYVIWAKQLHTSPVSYQLMYFDFVSNQWQPLTGQTLQEINLIKQLAFGSLNTTEIQAGLEQLGGASILEYLLNQNQNNCNSFKNCLNNLPIINVEDLYGSGFGVALEFRANQTAIQMGLKPGDAFWLRLEGTKEVPLVLCRVREYTIGSGSGSGSGEGSNGVGGGVIDAWLNAHYFPIGTSNDTLFGGAQMGPYARLVNSGEFTTGEFTSTGITSISSWGITILKYDGTTVTNASLNFNSSSGTFTFTTNEISLLEIKEIRISISAYVAGGITYTSGQYIWKRQTLTNKTPLSGYTNTSGLDFNEVAVILGDNLNARLLLITNTSNWNGIYLGLIQANLAQGTMGITGANLETRPLTNGLIFFPLNDNTSLPLQRVNSVNIGFNNVSINEPTQGIINGQLRFE